MIDLPQHAFHISLTAFIFIEATERFIAINLDLCKFIIRSAAKTSGELQNHFSRGDRGKLHLCFKAAGRDCVECGERQPHHAPTCDKAATARWWDHSSDQYADCPVWVA